MLGTENVVGVDVGESRFFCAAIRGGEVSLSDDASDLVATKTWILNQRPARVAIDAPPRPNLGLLASEEYRVRHGFVVGRTGVNRRVAEWRLGIGGCYSTRARREDCQRWMWSGMSLFDALEAAGMEIELGQGGNLLEVHPTYGFRSVLGAEQNGYRVRPDPRRLLRRKMPRGSIGHRQRLGLLDSLGQREGVRIGDSARVRMARSLDWTDASLAAFLALLHLRDRVLVVGEPEHREGAIVLARLDVPLQLENY